MDTMHVLMFLHAHRRFASPKTLKFGATKQRFSGRWIYHTLALHKQQLIQIVTLQISITTNWSFITHDPNK
jgi:hypothetical protein